MFDGEGCALNAVCVGRGGALGTFWKGRDALDWQKALGDIALALLCVMEALLLLCK